jgi:hypothetical protein
MEDTTMLIIVLVAVVAVAIIAMLAFKAKRRKDLQSRFGPEYDRTVDRADNPREAERELKERAATRDRLELRDLTPAEQTSYRREWQELQAAFVDRPDSALADADELVSSVMRDRGYPVDDFEQQADLVSVDHPQVVEHYRAAHEIHERNQVDEVSTEDQRRAVVHYRSLFDELMHPAPGGDGDGGDGRSVDDRTQAH